MQQYSGRNLTLKLYSMEKADDETVKPLQFIEKVANFNVKTLHLTL